MGPRASGGGARDVDEDPRDEGREVSLDEPLEPAWKYRLRKVGVIIWFSIFLFWIVLGLAIIVLLY